MFNSPVNRSATVSVSDDLPMPGPAMTKTAWLVRFRTMLQILSSGSRRPVSDRCAAPGLCPLDESSQITPGSYAELGEHLVEVPLNSPD